MRVVFIDNAFFLEEKTLYGNTKKLCLDKHKLLNYALIKVFSNARLSSLNICRTLFTEHTLTTKISIKVSRIQRGLFACINIENASINTLFNQIYLIPRFQNLPPSFFLLKYVIKKPINNIKFFYILCTKKPYLTFWISVKRILKAFYSRVQK